MLLAASSPVSPLYAAAACLVAAQIVGIYALKTRRADLIFSLVMLVLVIAGFSIEGIHLYHRLH